MVIYSPICKNISVFAFLYNREKFSAQSKGLFLQNKHNMPRKIVAQATFFSKGYKGQRYILGPIPAVAVMPVVWRTSRMSFMAKLRAESLQSFTMSQSSPILQGRFVGRLWLTAVSFLMSMNLPRKGYRHWATQAGNAFDVGRPEKDVRFRVTQ